LLFYTVLVSECDKEVEAIFHQQHKTTPGADISPTPPVYSPISGFSTGFNPSSSSGSISSPDRATSPNASPEPGPSNTDYPSNDGDLNESTAGGHPYIVKEVDQSDIFDLKQFVKDTNWEEES
jgi:hypothetical protein